MSKRGKIRGGNAELFVLSYRGDEVQVLIAWSGLRKWHWTARPVDDFDDEAEVHGDESTFQEALKAATRCARNS